MNKTQATPLPVSDRPAENATAPAPSQVAQNVCPDCAGRGLDAHGAACATCKGDGHVLETVGDA